MSLHWGEVVAASARRASEIPGGAGLGKTDAEGGTATHNEYFSDDIAATLYTKLGIPLDLTTETSDGRPIPLNEGKPIKEWIS